MRSTVFKFATIVALLFLSLCMALLMPAPGEAQTAASEAKQVPAGEANLSSSQKAQFEKLIHDYILAHPEILLEAQQALEAKAEVARLDHIKGFIEKHKAALYHQDDDLVLGNPEGEIAIVEFFDYNCPHCKRTWGAMEARIKAEPRLKLILKIMPYISKDSARVGALAVASRMQGTFAAFHAALMSSKGQATEQSALRLASSLGINVEKLKQDADKEAVKVVVTRANELSKTMNLQGSPFFFIDDQHIAYAPDDFEAKLDVAINAVARTGCRLC